MHQALARRLMGSRGNLMDLEDSSTMTLIKVWMDPLLRFCVISKLWI